MSIHRRSTHSTVLDVVLPASLLAIEILLFQLIYWKHSFLWRDLLVTSAGTLVLYSPYFWFRSRVPQRKTTHLLLTCLALTCMVPFMFIDWILDASTNRVFFFIWGTIAALILASNVIAIRLSTLPRVVPAPLSPTGPERSTQELEAETRARLTRGIEIYQSHIAPGIDLRDNGKFVVVDIATGDFEIAATDAVATARLLKRRPAAFTYATRAGRTTAYRIGLR